MAETPGWNSDKRLFSDELMTMAIIERLLEDMDPQALNRVVGFLLSKYQEDDGWSNYNILKKQAYESATVGRGIVAGQ